LKENNVNKNKSMRRLGSAAALILVSGTAVTLAPGWTARATPNDCDGYGVVGVFNRVGSGASFTYNGRSVELQNESVLDTYSRVEIKSGRQSGDLVWADRSNRRFSLSTKGIVSNATAESQGWKQCGPFSEARTQSVNNSVHAARACAHMDGRTVCGNWYVD
jgi:hypothetical protein